MNINNGRIVEDMVAVNPVYFKYREKYCVIDGVTFMFGNPAKVENRTTIKKLRENPMFIELGESLVNEAPPEIKKEKVKLKATKKSVFL